MYKDIQYFHSPSQEYTIAVKLDFNRADLEDVLSNPTLRFNIKVGVALVHPNDTYSKAIGREVSESDLQHRSFHLHTVHVEYHDSKTRLVYRFINEKEGIELSFRTSHLSERPHFINAYLAEKDSNKF